MNAPVIYNKIGNPIVSLKKSILIQTCAINFTGRKLPSFSLHTFRFTFSTNLYFTDTLLLDYIVHYNRIVGIIVNYDEEEEGSDR